MSPHRSWEDLIAAIFSRFMNSICDFVRMPKFVGVIHPQSLVHKLQTSPDILLISTETSYTIPAKIRGCVKWKILQAVT